MFIQSDFAEDARHQNVDPAIIVEGGSISYTNDAIGNSANLDIYKLAHVQQHYQFLARSNINIHCIAGSDDAAEELGFEVAMFIQSMRPISATMLELQEVGMPQQSKPQLMNRSEWSGKYDSVVSFPYAFAIRRKHTPVDFGELLKEINVQLVTDGYDPIVPRKPIDDSARLPKTPVIPPGLNPGDVGYPVIPVHEIPVRIDTSADGEVSITDGISSIPEYAPGHLTGILGGPTSLGTSDVLNKYR